MAALHEGLRPTRGGAAAIALIQPGARRLTYTGLGNINGVVLSAQGQHHLVSHNGIVGHQASRIVEFHYEWTPDSVLVMHSDGLSGKWDIDRYPGLLARHPGLVAATLYRDYVRGRDDASILVAREARE
jgi:hypothetical protein